MSSNPKSVGRDVWFWPLARIAVGTLSGTGGRLAAKIVQVNENGSVNLVFWTARGLTDSALAVAFVVDGDERPTNKDFCELPGE